MIEYQINKLRLYAKEYESLPYHREIEGTKELLEQAADTIEALSAKLADMGRSAAHHGDGWVSCEDGLPEESLNSVIGWDEHRKRCCFVQYWGGRWILGNDIDSVKIVAWRPLPEPYQP